MTTAQSPKTRGPNLSEMTLRERAAHSYAETLKRDEVWFSRNLDRVVREALGPVTYIIIGTPPARRDIEVEGLRFAVWVDARIFLASECRSCGTNILGRRPIENLSDLGMHLNRIEDEDGVQCQKCADREG